MKNSTIRKDVPPGTHVMVVKKEDQRTGMLTEGIVKDILTNSANHPRGIKVAARIKIVQAKMRKSYT
jgi:uncharacterized repeat protein (TIGR03833 family)